ncbi:MAG: peroxiredoxin family protein [Planctomycetota bacterium]|jgi:peroxiredoxin
MRNRKNLVITLLAVIIASMLSITGCKKSKTPVQEEKTVSKPKQENTLKVKEAEPIKPPVKITSNVKDDTVAKVERKVASQKPVIKLTDIIKSAKTWGATNQHWYGKTAPDFILKDINGKTHKLSDYKGKNIILIFWATWCPPCRAEIPYFQELRRQLGEEKLAILAASNESLEKVKGFATAQKMNYTVLLDDGKMPEPFGVQRIYSTTGIPGSFFINPEGKIKLATSGVVPLAEIKAILQAE